MFEKGDSVIVKHDKALGVGTVINPHDPTDMVRVITKEPVGHYVRVEFKIRGEMKVLGYHDCNLEKVESDAPQQKTPELTVVK